MDGTNQSARGSEDRSDCCDHRIGDLEDVVLPDPPSRIWDAGGQEDETLLKGARADHLFNAKWHHQPPVEAVPDTLPVCSDGIFGNERERTIPDAPRQNLRELRGQLACSVDNDALDASGVPVTHFPTSRVEQEKIIHPG